MYMVLRRCPADYGWVDESWAAASLANMIIAGRYMTPKVFLLYLLQVFICSFIAEILLNIASYLGLT